MSENRYILSAPRSGLNWVRYCVEYYCKLETPGRHKLIEQDTPPKIAFTRTHDPYRYRLRSLFGLKYRIAWTPVTRKQTLDAKVVLLIRNPIELFVRMAGKDYAKMKPLFNCIEFFDKLDHSNKAVFYYEDFTDRAESMFELIKFLDFDLTHLEDEISLDFLQKTWLETAQLSRADYNIEHKAGGGAMTKGDPKNFKFHSASLEKQEIDLIWGKIERDLSSSQYALLSRYKNLDQMS